MLGDANAACVLWFPPSSSVSYGLCQCVVSSPFPKGGGTKQVMARLQNLLRSGSVGFALPGLHVFSVSSSQLDSFVVADFSVGFEAYWESSELCRVEEYFLYALKALSIFSRRSRSCARRRYRQSRPVANEGKMFNHTWSHALVFHWHFGGTQRFSDISEKVEVVIGMGFVMAL